MKKIGLILAFLFLLSIESYAQDVGVETGFLLISVGPAQTATAKKVAELLITDPLGRQAGLDISTGEILQEIPNASYGKDRIDDLETGEPGKEAGTFESVVPSSGIYKVDVIGDISENYSLIIFAYDVNGIFSTQRVERTIYPGRIDNYEITYSSAPGSQLKVNFVGSSEIYEFTSTIKIHPDRWNLNWYNRIKEHMEEKEWIRHFAKKVTILCMITNLKDNQGKPYSVKEIVPETILLNYLLHPQPWRFKSEEKIALIVKSKEDRYLKERKGFKEWHHTNILSVFELT